MLTDDEILTIVRSEESAALSFSGPGSPLSADRALLIDYYNQELFGDEEPNQSTYVTSDVYDVVEGMIPPLLRTFTQGQYIGKFESDTIDYEEEAKQKTVYANWVFMRQNNGVKILRDMFWDALAQYAGTVKIYFDEIDDIKTKRFKGLSEAELAKLKLDENAEFLEEEEREVEVGEGEATYTVWDAVVNYHNNVGKIRIVNIPPDELLIHKDSKDYIDPPFIGQLSPMTRTELIQMGFDEELINRLPADNGFGATDRNARYKETSAVRKNESSHKPNDIIWLGEYYMKIDVDGDGVAERWKIFMAGNELLEKERADDHPYATIVSIPLPHRAIGTCPAEKTKDIQYLHSTLTRQALNNIYHTNFSRTIINDRVDMDELLTPRIAGVIEVEGVEPVQGALQQWEVRPIVAEILQMKEEVQNQREQRTGVTRHNQGLDTESLNKTATGFVGLRDMGQMKVEMIERLFADGGIKHMFEKIIDIAVRHQNDKQHVKLFGKPMEIDPSRWESKMECRIDVGIGAGDRQEKIGNLNYMLQQQKELLVSGSVLADQKKMYNTLNKLVDELGLKSTGLYFNDPEQPDEVLQAQNEQLQAMVQQLQQQLDNPLAEAERVRAEGRLMEKQSDNQLEVMKLMQKQQEAIDNLAAKYTEMELKYGQNVPGSTV